MIEKIYRIDKKGFPPLGHGVLILSHFVFSISGSKKNIIPVLYGLLLLLAEYFSAPRGILVAALSC